MSEPKKTTTKKKAPAKKAPVKKAPAKKVSTPDETPVTPTPPPPPPAKKVGPKVRGGGLARRLAAKK